MRDVSVEPAVRDQDDSTDGLFAACPDDERSQNAKAGPPTSACPLVRRGKQAGSRPWILSLSGQQCGSGHAE
jgi:hypothetical protein